MFENPRRGRQPRNFTSNVPKILALKSSSEQIFSRKLPLGAPDAIYKKMNYELTTRSWYTAVLVSPGAVRDETKNGFVAD